MTLTQKALSAAATQLRGHKRIAQEASLNGMELPPGNVWGPADDAALDLVEQAMARERGEQPLFREIPA